MAKSKAHKSEGEVSVVLTPGDLARVLGEVATQIRAIRSAVLKLDRKCTITLKLTKPPRQQIHLDDTCPPPE